MLTCDFCGIKDIGVRKFERYPKEPCLCIECVAKGYVCQNCRHVDVMPARGMTPLPYCNNCAVECEDCGGKGGIRREGFGKELCTSCYSKYKICEHCFRTHKTSRKRNTVLQWEHCGVSGDTCPDCLKSLTRGQTAKPLGNCNFCGDLTAMYQNHSYYCSSCRGDINIEKCGCCGVDNHNMIDTEDGLVCHHCATKYYFACNVCNTWKKKEKRKHSTPMCLECSLHAVPCEVCNQLTIKVSEVQGYLVCGMCLRNTISCITCGERTFSTSAQRCDSCIYQHGAFAMENWRYKAPVFKFKGNGSLFYGIENEFSVDEEDVESFGQYLSKRFHRDTLYYQFDGSIAPRDSGLEVVLHPFTFDLLYKQSLDSMFSPPGIRIEPNVTCGMHIHMSKDAFTRFHLLKFMYFFYENPEFIIKMAGRDYNERNPSNGRLYCYGDRSRREMIEKALYKGGPDRYQAINVTPEKTIEVRVFQGATTPKEFYRNVEFCDALYYYTKRTKRSKLSVKGFFKFVSENREKYLFLHDYLGAK